MGRGRRPQDIIRMCMVEVSTMDIPDTSHNSGITLVKIHGRSVERNYVLQIPSDVRRQAFGPRHFHSAKHVALEGHEHADRSTKDRTS
jgi:hypothetical protein